MRIKNRVIAESVTSSGQPRAARFKNSGITDPRDSTTFPYRTIENRVPPCPEIPLEDMNIRSAHSLLAPYRFAGLHALSVDSAINRCTLFSIAAMMTLL